MMEVLEVFHHKVDWRLAVTTSRRINDGEWEWLTVATVLDTTGLWKMREYIRRHQVTILDYIMGHPIFEIHTRDERM